MSTWKELPAEEKIAAIRTAHKHSVGTASTIAAYLSIKFEEAISRSAVIGFYHRNTSALASTPLLGPKTGPNHVRSRKPAPKPKAVVVKLAKVEKPKLVKPAKADPFAGVSRPAPFLKRIKDDDWDGRHECRWPVDGEKENTRFCCHPVSGESSYCAYHRLAARGRGTESERKVAPMPVRKVA